MILDYFHEDHKVLQTWMEKILALQILISLFDLFPSGRRNWIEEVDYLVQRRGCKNRYYLDPAYSLVQVSELELKYKTALKMKKYFQELIFSLKNGNPFGRSGSENSLAKELVYYLSRSHRHFPDNKNIQVALNLIVEWYLSGSPKAIKIDSYKIHYNQAIIEALLDAYEWDMANRIVCKWISVLRIEFEEYSNELSELHTIRGTIYSFQGNFPRSAADFKMATDLNVYNLRAHKGLVSVFLQNRQWMFLDLYLSCYEKYLSKWKSFRVIDALRYAFTGKFNEILETIKKQIEENPEKQAEFLLFNFCCGFQQFRNSNYEKSLKYFQRQLSFDQDCAIALLKIPFIAFNLGQYDTALSYCKIIKEKNVQTNYIKVLQFACLLKLNKLKKAMKLLRCWQNTYREGRCEDQLFLLEIYKMLGQNKKIIACMRDQFYDNQQKLTFIRMQILLMQSYKKLGNKKQVVKTFHKIIELSDHKQWIWIPFRQFHLLFYLIDYSFRQKLFAEGKIISQLMREFIQLVKTVCVKSAEEMERMLFQRQVENQMDHFFY